jgi:DUF971 family protein
MNDPRQQAVRVKRAVSDPERPGRFRMEVSWADGSESTYPWSYLRALCPCATCRASVVTRVSGGGEAADGPETHVKALSNVGHYALGVAFEDGHSAILPWDYVRELDPARPLEERLAFLRLDKRLH